MQDVLSIARTTAALHEVSVVVCDNAYIRALNKQWLGINEATDVLSFEMADDVDAVRRLAQACMVCCKSAGSKPCLTNDRLSPRMPAWVCLVVVRRAVSGHLHVHTCASMLRAG